MKKMLPFLVFVMFCVYQASSLCAAPEAQVHLSKTKIQRGETLTVQVQMTWPEEEGAYQFLLAGLPIKNLELIRRGEAQEIFRASGKSWIQKTFTFELKSTGLGQGLVEAFQIQYSGDNFLEPAVLNIAEQTVTVKNTFSLTPMVIIALLCLVGLIAFFIGGLVWMARKKNKKRAEASQLSKEEVVVNTIRAYLNDSKNPKQLLNELSSQFKEYVTDHYHLGSLKQGETELINKINKSEIEFREKKQLQDIFEQIHAVKFAGEGMSEREIRSFAEKMIYYIESKKVVGILD